ncbi:histone-lysine N-methyltransferase SETMAR [Trichonephila clavipes]|nr:histone-lysine N-methyltransferase SETMAR [Trichonephila clavipes]
MTSLHSNTDQSITMKTGDTSLEDKLGRGRRSDFDDQALLEAVEEDESLTTRMLAEDFNVNQSTVVRRLKKLGKLGILSPRLSHRLTFKNIKRKKVCVSPKGIPKHFYCKKAMWCVWWDRSARGIDHLSSKWEAVIEVDGDYAPE